jgi:hypothetical protein
MRDKAELITILKLMLQQRPEWSWVSQAPQPVAGKPALSIDVHLLCWLQYMGYPTARRGL